MFTAIALLYTKGQSVQATDLPDLLNWTGETFPVGGFRISTGVVLVAILYLVVGFALANTAVDFFVHDEALSGSLPVSVS